jgi:hypothetical protein
MSQSANLRHQVGQGFPRVNTPLVNPDTGILTTTWLAFLQSLWMEVKGGSGLIAEQVLSTSPWTFTSPQQGTLMLSGGTITDVQLSRDGTNFFPVGQLAGPVTIGAGDLVLVAYTVLPRAVFVPI